MAFVIKLKNFFFCFKGIFSLFRHKIKPLFLIYFHVNKMLGFVKCLLYRDHITLEKRASFEKFDHPFTSPLYCISFFIICKSFIHTTCFARSFMTKWTFIYINDL